jgi:hypothetical protein
MPRCLFSLQSNKKWQSIILGLARCRGVSLSECNKGKPHAGDFQLVPCFPVSPSYFCFKQKYVHSRSFSIGNRVNRSKGRGMFFWGSFWCQGFFVSQYFSTMSVVYDA